MIERLPGFAKRMSWFLENRPDLARHIACMEPRHERPDGASGCWRSRRASAWSACCATCSTRTSSSRRTASARSRGCTASTRTCSPSTARIHRVDYEPGEGDTGLFGGNSNWRGPVWFPINYLLIEALERYHHFYGDDLKVECPIGSGRMLDLQEVARELAARLGALFLPDATGGVPATATTRASPTIPHWQDLVLFHEYFHGDTGRGVGASHQTGWTALVRPLHRGPGPPAWRAVRLRRRPKPRHAWCEPAMSAPIAIDDRTEWLEADGLGGFASGTTGGVRTRRRSSSAAAPACSV